MTKIVLFLICFVTIFSQNFSQTKRGNIKSFQSGIFHSVKKIEKKFQIQNIVDEVDSAKIYSTLSKLQSFKTKFAGNSSGRDSLAKTRNWLISRLESFGYSDILQHNFNSSGFQFQNIVATKIGTEFPDSIIILCGHYDTVDGPGINDNGTGTAIVLESARIFANKNLKYTVQFIFFSCEESGLVGSQNYVQQIVLPQQQKLKLVINIDEVGGIKENPTNIIKVEKDNDNNPSSNNFLSARFTDTLAAITETYSSLQTIITNAFGSDYIPFENAGFVITGFYESITTPHYHQITDSLSHVDMKYVYEICKSNVAGITHFGKLQEKFVSIFHTPIITTDDTINSYKIIAKTKSSATIFSQNLFYSINNGEFQQLEMNFLGTQNDTSLFETHIPTQQYNSNVKYFFKFISFDSVTSRLPQNENTNFEFSILPDTVAPTIIFTQPISISENDFPLEIKSTILDEHNIDIAWIKWSHNEFQFVDTMTEISQNVFRFFLENNFQFGDSISLQIFARDNSLRKNIANTNLFSYQIFKSIFLLHTEESDSGNFFPTNDWQFGNPLNIPPQPSGLKVWGTNILGNYSNNLISILETQNISLSNKKNPILTFKHFYKIEPANDGGNVSVIIDNLQEEILIPQNGYPFANIVAINSPGFSGNSYVWKEEKFNLSEYENHNIKIIWKFGSDALINQKGWYLDNIRIDFLPDSTSEVFENNFPNKFSLKQNFPNPFNPKTKIKYEIAKSGFVSLKIYDVLGREIKTLVNENKNVGFYEIEFDANNLNSGIYFYKLTTNNFSEMKKMILIK